MILHVATQRDLRLYIPYGFLSIDKLRGKKNNSLYIIHHSQHHRKSSRQQYAKISGPAELGNTPIPTKSVDPRQWSTHVPPPETSGGKPCKKKSIATDYDPE